MSKEFGFETILDTTDAVKANLAGISEENYCPDCYDCNINCEESDADN